MTISLNEMATVVQSLLDAELIIENQENQLKESKENARKLREEVIPSSMQELGLAELKLDTGQKITVKQDVYASIPKDNKLSALQWLEDHGHGGLIKTDVVTSYGKGEEEEGRARKLLFKLLAEGEKTKLSRGINAQTLKAFLREQIAKGEDVPLDLFGASPVWTTKIK